MPCLCNNNEREKSLKDLPVKEREIFLIENGKEIFESFEKYYNPKKEFRSSKEIGETIWKYDTKNKYNYHFNRRSCAINMKWFYKIFMLKLYF